MTEIWKEIPEYAPYEISNHGRLRRGDRIIDGNVSKSTGYRRTAIYGKEVLFHRLVAATFVGQCPEGYEVNHLDANRINNVPENLEYCTKADNQRYVWAIGRGPTGKRHGRHTKPECTARGEDAGTAKLTEEQVIAIRQNHKSGHSYNRLAADFAISKSQISNIVKRMQWRHI